MSSTTDWVNKHIHIMEYYNTIKQNKLQITTIWKNCIDMMMREEAKHKST